MKRHLEDHEMAAAVIGADLGAEARAHLADCMSCRRQVAAFGRLAAERRNALEKDAPDWQRQRRRILDRLPPRPVVVAMPRRRWRRSLIAAAAAVVAAIGIGVLGTGVFKGNGQAEIPIEQILAEVDATLESDGLPGFEVLDEIVPSTDDLEEYFANGAS